MQRPRVLVNMASSLDGKTNPAPAQRSGPFTMSRHPEDPARMLNIRAMAGALVIGTGNLIADDPDLALAPEERARRRSTGAREPLRVIVTRSANRLNTQYAVFDRSRGGETIIVHALPIAPSVRDELASVATLVRQGEATDAPDANVDIRRMLDWLLRERGVDLVLSEGGGTLNAAFFAAQAVDSMYLTVVPRVLGGAHAPTAVDGAGFAACAPPLAHLAKAPTVPDATLGDVARVGDELFLRYDFRWPGPLDVVGKKSSPK